MTNTVIWTIAIITVLGLLLALVLYLVAKKFKVEEDPRIDEVEKVMPGANCGGCGFAGCRAFAEAAVKAPDLESIFCPVGGNDVMAQVATILGYEVKAKAPEVAVVRCNGTCEARPRVNEYDGFATCAVKAALYAGDTACAYGCLGYGACANVCPKGAISIHDGLAKVDKRLCIGCGKCVTVCPKKLIELVPASATIHVLCANPDKGPSVRKVCGVGCMGCHLCEKNSGGKEAGHFTFQGFLAKVNYENPPTDEQIAAKCPAKCMSVDPHFESGH
jgi:Na+-translocating ferredoxin:NAD+ oxidoreductase RNF subunit RnfB